MLEHNSCKHGTLGWWGEQKPKKWCLLLLLDAPAAWF